MPTIILRGRESGSTRTVDRGKISKLWDCLQAAIPRQDAVLIPLTEEARVIKEAELTSFIDGYVEFVPIIQGPLRGGGVWCQNQGRGNQILNPLATAFVGPYLGGGWVHGNVVLTVSEPVSVSKGKEEEEEGDLFGKE